MYANSNQMIQDVEKKNTTKITKPEEDKKITKQPKQSTKNKFDFDQKIIELGNDAIELLKEKEYEKLDPLVSDWSCQLRTFWLIKLIRENPSLENFSDEQKFILGLYKLLTDSKNKETDSFGMGITENTNTKYRPLGWESLSNRALVESYGTAKKCLSDKIIENLIEEINKTSIDEKDLILEALNKKTFTKYSGISIRFIDFFVGYLAITKLALQHNIPIVVNLKQFLKDEDNKLSLGGAKTLFYKPCNGAFIATEPSETEENAPCIAIQMYTGKTLHGNTATNKASGFITQEYFDQFWSEFKELNIVDIILAIAATHSQFPEQAFLLDGKNQIPIKQSVKSNTLQSMFDKFFLWGNEKRYGIDSYFSQENGYLEKEISINTKHVHISTFKIINEHLTHLLETMKNNHIDLKAL